MIDIIICEDNEDHRKRTERIINDEIVNIKSDSKIKLSTNKSTEVIKYLKENNDRTYIYFLDVDLNEDINGIELAKIIRGFDSIGYIIFITSHSELALQTFKLKVQAMDYILKFDRDILRKSVRDCIIEANKNYHDTYLKKNSFISINIGRRIERFNTNEIIFFETTEIDHKLRVHTNTGQTEFYGSMKEIEEEINSDFYKIHRSYLINLKKVKSIDKKALTVIMVNDEMCIVAKRYLKELIKKC